MDQIVKYATMLVDSGILKNDGAASMAGSPLKLQDIIGIVNEIDTDQSSLQSDK